MFFEDSVFSVVGVGEGKGLSEILFWCSSELHDDFSVFVSLCFTYIHREEELDDVFFFLSVEQFSVVRIDECCHVSKGQSSDGFMVSVGVLELVVFL